VVGAGVWTKAPAAWGGGAVGAGAARDGCPAVGNVWAKWVKGTMGGRLAPNWADRLSAAGEGAW